MKPFCFVITSFSKKPNLKDLQAKFDLKKTDIPVQNIDFDKIYDELVEPAIKQAGMEPLIERQEQSFGSIDKTMYEKIILCEFCIADLTNLNPNAYYELGMRYAVRPFTTIPIIASSHFPLPFDISTNRTYTYKVNQEFELANKEQDISQLVKILRYARENRKTDSPLYDLVNGISFQNTVAHEKTDVFRDRVIYDEEIAKELKYARTASGDDPQKVKSARIDAINKVVEKYKPLDTIETGVLIDMMLSYRNIKAFEEMLAFIKQLPRYVFETIMVQEQYAFALNRTGSQRQPVDDVMIDEAEAVLRKLEIDKKASSETYGIWGRIHKDKYDRAYGLSMIDEANVHLENALAYYRKGFESDMRDAYPGINYVTCLELSGDRANALRMAPVVEYAVRSAMKRKEPNYWDYATLMELAVIENNMKEATSNLIKARSVANETRMFDTTRGNLDIIINYRKQRGEETADIEKLARLLG